MDIDLTKDFLGITEFRSLVRETIERIEQTRRPVVLTSGGRPSAVLLDVYSYQELINALQQTNRQVLLESISKAESDLSEGRVCSHAEAMNEFQRRREQRANAAQNKEK